MKHLFWPQWYETGNHTQKEDWKNHKYVEIKQHATEQPMGQRSQKRNQQKWKTTYQNLRDAAKVILRGQLIAVETYFNNERTQ